MKAEVAMRIVERNGFRTTTAALAFVAIALSSSPAAESAGKHYPSPEEASKALAAALEAHDRAALLAILGADSADLIDSGDEVADRNASDRFVKRYAESNRIVKEGDARAVLDVGKDNWPFPIPMVKEEAGWRFDAEAGEEEILNRRIGRNELSAVQVCLAMADAQREYYLRNPDEANLLHYASRILSSEGKRDGLYWPTAEGEDPSPLGPLVAEAHAEGYAHGKEQTDGPRPYHGYLYRILTSQGPDAPGGAYDYMAQGKMIGGFAVVAWPAEYGDSGVMTFLVNHDGVVYEKDLGLETETLAEKITAFNPDSTWQKVKDDDPDA
jgi:hypothetical protein